MKNLGKEMTSLTIFLSLTFIIISSCCSTSMTDEDFVKISFDYGMKVVPDAMNLASGKITQKEFDKKTEPILEECCKKYGYSLGDYKCKAEKFKKEQDKKIDDALKN
jgi:hypothetical protein